MKTYCHFKLTIAICAALVCLGSASGTARAVAAPDIDACLACHQDRNLTKKDAAGKQHSLFVDKEAFQKSQHGAMGYACIDCHAGVEAKKHPAGGIPNVKCASAECHTAELAKYEASSHGKLLKSGNTRAPQCYDCHSMHAVLPSKELASTVNAANLAKTCGACHEEQAKQALCPLLMDFVKGEEPASSLTLTALAAPVVTRVKGHGKVNLGCAYTTRDCTTCHLDVVNHGTAQRQPAACSNCHAQAKTAIVFGKLHKSNAVTDPFLCVLLALGYIAGIAGMVFYFRQDGISKAGGGEPPSAEG